MALAIKYRVSGDFSLVTEISPDNIESKIDDAIADIGEDFQGGSYFSTQQVTADGGSFSVTVTADDEDDAESKVREAIADGFEFEDYNGFTWLVEDLSFDIEVLEEEPPTVEEAIQILSDFVDSENDRYPRVAKAAEVILDDHSRLGRRVQDLETRVAGTEEQIRQLSARLQQVTDAACPQPVDQ